MWFNNALLYQYEWENPVNLNELLSTEILKPCPPHARFVYGWLPVCDNLLAQEVASTTLFCMGKEERILPRSVIQRMLQERIQQIETQQGRTVKRSEKAKLSEDLEFELLPKSFCVQKRVFALMDHTKKRLTINSASTTQASQLLALLRKSVPNIRIEPLAIGDHLLSMRLAEWIRDPMSLPANFQLAPGCVLYSLDDEKKRFSCKGYELPADEVLALLSQGLAAAELNVVWNDRIQFTLTQDASLKRLKCLDYLLDAFQDVRHLDDERQEQDAALTLLSGELNALTNDLLQALQSAEEKTFLPAADLEESARI